METHNEKTDRIRGTFTGNADLSGLALNFTQAPTPSTTPDADYQGQLGVGANGKNSGLGFSSWFMWSIVQCDDGAGNNGCDFLGLASTDEGVGDININLSPVPVPAAFWLFGTAMFTLVGLCRKSRAS